METFDPDGRSDVDGSDCDYSDRCTSSPTRSRHQPVVADCYSYDMADQLDAGEAGGRQGVRAHERSIVVGPGDTETYTARYTVNGEPAVGRFWFNCQVSRAQKTRM